MPDIKHNKNFKNATNYLVKICGINSIEAALQAEKSNADYLGFIFFPKSPRHISYHLADEIANALNPKTNKVAVTVDITDAKLTNIIETLKPNYIQLHGSETPERIEEIKNKFGLKIIKAISISDSTDLLKANDYAGLVEYILFDAKPPKDSVLPGGNAVSFDWNILKNFNPKYNWALSGGLNSKNVADAIKITGANFVDTSSGVESAPGVKDLQKIADFISAAKQEKLTQTIHGKGR